jgi:hypothetical protein
MSQVIGFIAEAITWLVSVSIVLLVFVGIPAYIGAKIQRKARKYK